MHCNNIYFVFGHMRLSRSSDNFGLFVIDPSGVYPGPFLFKDRCAVSFFVMPGPFSERHAILG